MKKAAIVQSNSITLKGYFDMIVAVNEYIFYNDMQFGKNEWYNLSQKKSSQIMQ